MLIYPGGRGKARKKEAKCRIQNTGDRTRTEYRTPEEEDSTADNRVSGYQGAGDQEIRRPEKNFFFSLIF